MNNKKRLAFIGAAALLAVVAGYYFLIAPAVVRADRVAGYFAEGLKGALDLDLKYADARFRIFPRPSVWLEDAVVANGSGKTVVTADRIKLGLSFFGFLTLRPGIAVIELDKPRLDLAPGDIGFGAEGKAASFRGTIIVTDGFMRYAGEKRAAFFDGLNGRLRCKAQWGKELEIRGKLAADRVSFGGLKEEKGGGMALAAEGKLRYRPGENGGHIYFEPLDLLFDQARLTCRGQLGTGMGERDVDLSFSGKKMALKQVLPALAPERFEDADIGGEMSVDLRAKGKWGAGARPDIRGTLSVEKGSLTPEGGEGISNVGARVRFEGENYIIENLQGQTRRGGFKGYGKIVSDQNWPFDMNLEGALPLEVLACVLGVPQGYMISGPAQFALDVNGALAGSAGTTLDGTIELAGCRVRLKPFVQPFDDLTGTIFCDGVRVRAGKVRGRLGGGAFEIGGGWEGFETPRIDMVVVGQDFDLDAALPRDKEGKAKIEGETVPLGLPGRAHTVKGTVKFKSCKLFKIKAANVEADFAHDAGILNITKLNFDAYDGKVQAQLSVIPGPRPKYTCSAAISKARLGVFLTENRWLPDALTGAFSADVVFSAEGTREADIKKSFGGKGSLELAGGRAAKMVLLSELAKWSRIPYYDPLQITRVWTTVEAREGVLRSSDFKLENPDLTAAASGEVTLDKKLNLTVRTTFGKTATEKIAREGKALAFVRDAAGQGHFDFIITGEYAKPAFQLDAATMMGSTGIPTPGSPGGVNPGGGVSPPPGEIGEIF